MSYLDIFFRLNVVLDGKSHRPKVVCDQKSYRPNDFRRNVVHPKEHPDYLRFEGIQLKTAMMAPNKLSRNPRCDPRWLPKFTHCENGHYNANGRHKMAYLCNVINKLTTLNMLVLQRPFCYI